MERIYHIHGLDCANCAAKLERRLKEILWFDSVVIDFMAQKLILSASDETAMETGVNEALKVIEQMEPGVTIAKKEKKKTTRTEHEKKQEGTCSCGHEHHHVHETHVLQHEGTCSCSHEHHHVHETHVPQHDGTCSCGHDHHHVHEAHAPQHEGTCSCGHDHHHDHAEHVSTSLEVSPAVKGSRFTAEMKKDLSKICISAVLFFLTFLPLGNDLLRFGVYLLAYLIVGGEVLLRAGKNIARGQVFDENFLMTIATIGAFCVGEYPEGVMVMLFYQLGELFQEYALHRSRRSIAELMDIKPEIAHVKDGDKFVSMEPEAVIVGDVIQVRPGERVPLDGVVLEGHSALNTVALTGESVPREVTVGDAVQSGCINTSGVLLIRVEKEYEDSTVAKILDLVENASSKKAETENFITRFARYYTPMVVLIAVVLAILPPIVLQESFSEWVYRALVFLVISCPCALVISVPLTYFCGLGVCSRQGILVKGSNYLEAMAQMETAVFDKTGTLTEGHFSVIAVHTYHSTEEQLLYYAACAESISNHPIAEAIGEVNKKTIAPDVLQETEEIAGQGISAMVDGHHVLVGNVRLLQNHQIQHEEMQSSDTVVYVAVDGIFCGCIVIADRVKKDAKALVHRLKKIGVNNVVMLTGDHKIAAEQVAQQLGITQVFSQLLPGDKVVCLEEILLKKSPKTTVAFTGDGLNDAPVLARADIGIAMGGLGSDAAIEAADVVIMNDQPSKLVDAVRIARKTQRIVKENIIFVLVIKALVLLLGAIGMATMWMAVFADVGVAFLAILNAVRILKYE